MPHRQLWVTLGILAAITACGGDRKMIAIGPPPAKATSGALAGPLCQAGGCTCMSAPAEAGAPEPGTKRFEVKLGPSAHELWTTVAGRVLYKSPERPTMCFYVDLPPGRHPVELRASQPNGAVSAALAISELGTKVPTAYETFRFSCGAGGACSFEELDGKRAEYRAAMKDNTFDPCGSTKVREVLWDTGRSPDRLVPSELALRLVLHVYKFEPDRPHGDAACGAGDRGAAPPP